MGKKLVANLFLLLSMFTGLAHSIVPHHEHGQSVCFEATHCLPHLYQALESENLEFASQNHTHHPKSCCQKGTTLVSNHHRQHIQQSVNTDHSPLQFAVILWGYVSSGYLLSSLVEKKINHFLPYSNLYTSIFAHVNHGLRAPPFFN